MPFKIESYGLSDVGLVRENNEDVWAEIPDIGFFALADGMGGHQAGEVAARVAVDSLCESVEQNLADKKVELGQAKKLVEKAILQANYDVFSLSVTDDALLGMGTTLCCLYFHEEALIYGHIGDSRVYCLRNQELEQLTSDHSLVRELVDVGRIEESEASESAFKNVITRAVGTDPSVEPSVDICELESGDLYLICSDGLSDYVSPDEIKDALLCDDGLKEIGRNLVAVAKEKGGHDNITVVLIRVT